MRTGEGKTLTIALAAYLNALKEEGGIIILCSHFMPLMLGSRALLLNHRIANVYRPQNNKLFDKIMVKGYKKNSRRIWFD